MYEMSRLYAKKKLIPEYTLKWNKQIIFCLNCTLPCFIVMVCNKEYSETLYYCSTFLLSSVITDDLDIAASEQIFLDSLAISYEVKEN